MLNNKIVISFIWIWSKVLYIKWGIQAKDIREDDPKGNFWAQDGRKWEMEKALRGETFVPFTYFSQGD
jgi:hypothetical protein